MISPLATRYIMVGAGVTTAGKGTRGTVAADGAGGSARKDNTLPMRISERLSRRTRPLLSGRRLLSGALLGAACLGLVVPQAGLLASSHVQASAALAAPSAQLINHHMITPAGTQTSLGHLPMNAVLSPDGKYMLVANSGAYSPETLQVVSTATGQAVQTLPYAAPDGVVFGLAYSPDGSMAFASGGGFNTVHSYTVAANGQLTPAGDISLGAPTANIFPMGLAVTPDNATLLVANNLANTVSVVSLGGPSVVGSIPVGSYPYTVLVAPDGKRAYVSNWASATVGVIDLAMVTRDTAMASASAPAVVKAMTKMIKVGRHPTGMAFGPRGMLYVTNANDDSVSAIDTATDTVVRTISVAPYANAPLSSSPVSLAVSTGGRFLYVANAGENVVAVVDTVAGRTVGRVPTAWYPSTVVLSKDARTMYVTNAKGYGAGPNGYPINSNPNPTRRIGPFATYGGYCNCSQDQYSGSMIVGTLSTIAVPGSAELAAYSVQAQRNNHVADPALQQRPAGNPIPTPGGKSPITHVIYINKENRTFDQVFGDESAGNRDPHLTIFGRAVTPNLHALTERFGLLDNFYADAEVSADGHNWINGAYASDYNQKMWPQDYSQGAGRNRGYDFEGDSLINLNPGGYLWDSAAQAGITYRDYGNFFVFHGARYLLSNTKVIPATGACAGPVAHSYTYKSATADFTKLPAGTALCLPPEQVNPLTTPNLVGHFDPRYRTFDGNYREADRVAEWTREFNDFVKNGNLPALELLRFPNDHTSGTSAGKLTPQAAVAENDAAVGAVVDAVSHSPYWKNTMIVVTEDDGQNGPDHVDAHRTTSLVISAYNSHSSLTVDHTMYDTAAMIRTVGLVLGLRPLSQYDAQATPMWKLFNSTPDLTPYSAHASLVPVTNLNGSRAYGAVTSAGLNFAREDRAPAAVVNSILWHAVKGKDSAYPVTHYTVHNGDDQ